MWHMRETETEGEEREIGESERYDVKKRDEKHVCADICLLLKTAGECT